MAAFVKSVEHVTTTFNTSQSPVSNTINLSKGQDETKCVPYFTARATTSGADERDNDFFGAEMIDNAGTPAVRVHRDGAGVSTGSRFLDIFVVEFGDNVTVKQGTSSLTTTSSNAALSPAIVLANSFCVFSQVAIGGGGGGDDWNDACVQASFSSTTQVDFERRAGGNADWTIYWYVVESDGIDFLTEYVTFSWAGSDQTSARTLTNTVTLANAFVMNSWESSEPSDDQRDALCNVELTGTTTLTWFRDSSGVAETGTLGCWVVRTDTAGAGVQRVADDLAASTTNDTDITAIDEARSIIVNSGMASGGGWGVDQSTAGANVEDRTNSLSFLDSDTVRAQQQQAEAANGVGLFRYEVIEFELEVLLPGDLPILLMQPIAPAERRL